MIATPPNPGSDEARAEGCICAVIDNGYGRGAYGGKMLDDHGQPMFWRRSDCPLHGEQTSGGGVTS